MEDGVGALPGSHLEVVHPLEGVPVALDVQDGEQTHWLGGDEFGFVMRVIVRIWGGASEGWGEVGPGPGRGRREQRATVAPPAGTVRRCDGEESRCSRALARDRTISTVT